MTKQEADALYTFCCFGNNCDDCPFHQQKHGEWYCALMGFIYEKQYDEIIKTINNNPKYKRKQIFTNGTEWEIIKRFLTGVRLM